MKNERQQQHHRASKIPRFKHHCHIFLFILFTLFSITQSFDYADALSKSLLYFEAQRSGRLPYNQRVNWRHHSGLTDGLEQGVDLVGGYYDAGDHVKFGLPMAFTVTMLSWSAIEFRQEIVEAGELGHVMEAIKWGTDYFIKAHTSPNVLWAEVGDGDTDHYCWQRPEDMTTSRQAFKIDEKNPGSDLAGETAAAMAAASIVFRKTNPHYSQLLLHHAQQLFEFGDKYRGKYDGSVGVVKSYYASVSGYMDELLWGAMWLYKATDKQEYFDYIISNAHTFGGIGWSITEFSWDVKYAGLQVLASKFLMDAKHKKHADLLEQYRSKAEYYICSCLNKNNGSSNVERTPAGLLYVRQWNNMQYVSTAAFLLTVYSDFLQSENQKINCQDGIVGHDEILNFAKSQVDYILGQNPLNMSYLVGYGPNYPKRVHHRGASIVSYRANKGFIGCTQGYDNWYGVQEPNPNILVGALVGGPDNQDNFEDQRNNYVQTEACTYNTAPLVGVFAKFLQIGNRRGRPFSIEVGFFDTILEIKEKIQKYQGIPISKQTLIFNGQILPDDGDIWKCAIFQNSRIHLIVAASESDHHKQSMEDTKLHLNIKTPSSKPYFPIQIDKNDTVLKLKEKIHDIDQNNVPLNQLMLHSAGTELHDNQLIRDCDVSEKSEVEVSFKSPVGPAASPAVVGGGGGGSKKLKFMVLPKSGTKKIPVEMNATDNVGELRKELQKMNQRLQFHLPQEGYFFIYKQNVMDDEKSFRWHHVCQGDTIEIFNGSVTGGS